MEQGKASVSALRAAVSRAIHQLVDEPKIITDPVAVRLVDAAVPGAIEAGKQTFSPPELPVSRAIFVLRSRFVEEELAVAVTRGVRQYVILGAGLDTFAYRQPPHTDTLSIFEVDHPDMQAWKRESLAAADLALPSNLSWVPMDFEHQDLSEHLTAAGFDGARPAFFSWLGVSQYLTLAGINETLRFVAGLPSPTTIVLTFVLSDEALTDDERSRKRQFIQTSENLGEPWMTFFHPDDLCARLHDLGFSRVFNLTPEDANARYFAGRRDGMQVRPLEQLISATV